MEDLWRIVQSMQAGGAARGRAHRHRRHQGGRRGKGDGIFINTTGIGVIRRGRAHLAPARRSRRRGADQRRDRRARHRHHVGARGAGVRDRAAERFGAAARPGGADAGRRRASRSTCCATRRAAAWPARSTRSPRRRSVGIRLDETQHSRRRCGARGVRDPGARSALRGQRGQVPGHRGAGRRGGRAGDDARRIRWARRRRSSARWWRITRAR